MARLFFGDQSISGLIQGTHYFYSCFTVPFDSAHLAWGFDFALAPSLLTRAARYSFQDCPVLDGKPYRVSIA
jgi:hypothetical protein